MKGRILLAGAGLVVVLLLLPGPKAVPFEAVHLAMGTAVTIKLYADEKRAQQLLELATAELDRIGSQMSRYEAQSELEQLNRGAAEAPVRLSAEMGQVLQRSLYFARRTEGAFDPSVGPLTRLWGFPEVERPPAPAQIDSALALVGWSGVELAAGQVRFARGGMALDLGAAAKGFAVDRAVAVLEAAGATRGLVEAGGDIRFWGTKPDGKAWSFGVVDPRRPAKVGVFAEDIGLGALATSGDYEQVFEYGGRRYHHILDPATGYPATSAVSATVWATSAMDADILSTAVFALGPIQGLQLVETLPQVEALVFFEEDGRLVHRSSSGLAGRLRFAAADD